MEGYVRKQNHASVTGNCVNGNLYSFKKYIQMLHDIRIAALRCVIAGPRRETTNSHSHQWTIQCWQVASRASLCTVGGGRSTCTYFFLQYLERSIHFLPALPIVRVMEVLQPIPAVPGAKAGLNPGRVGSYCTANA